ncbi:sensor histidine kinase [Virgibacillus doumboii]|uniref:sensor histidine kinase n=1 Tax=Virgibacillus doumboii TaxID=2697503 RepID=UPI0013DE829F|nr:HAMP domain-containing sensor histidine kinase [Virgibacillus doumboii]
MRTLYVRIIVITMVIMIVSAIIAFAVTNIYYQYNLKPANDKKVTHIAGNIVSIFERNSQRDIQSYLTEMTDLGYKFYLVKASGQAKMYGEPFDSTGMESSAVDQVIKGEIYHGIANYPWRPFVTGFFDNKLKNTVGVPIDVNGKTHALFVRPNTTQQFGEMRMFLAVLLVLVLIISFLLVLISTRFIVKPVKKLTEATRKIATGNYHIRLNVNRRDEIGQLARDFAIMSDKLEQTEEKRQEFVSNVSHEFQSPLASIQGFSQALREEEMTEIDRTHYLSIIEKESRRLSQLSKQLLTLSHLDQEMNEIKKINVNLSNQLREVIVSTEWLWREKEIMMEMGDIDFTIMADPELLHQVWMNLVTNALRYMESGGTVKIDGTKVKDEVHITVEDNGIGIAQADIPHLFDRFYKVDKARTRTENSTGLGLSIVKKIVELHKGTIMVESEHGKGSRFHVTLPEK